MSYQIWSWVLGILGLLGFYLAGKKVWWCWYINIFNQILWLAYSLISHQYGFLVATAGYTIVFVKNAYSWTLEHREGYYNHDDSAPIGRVKKIEEILNQGKFEGISIGFELNSEELAKKLTMTSAELVKFKSELDSAAPPRACPETTEYDTFVFKCQLHQHDENVQHFHQGRVTGLFNGVKDIVARWDKYGLEVVEEKH